MTITPKQIDEQYERFVSDMKASYKEMITKRREETMALKELTDQYRKCR